MQQKLETSLTQLYKTLQSINNQLQTTTQNASSVMQNLANLQASQNQTINSNQSALLNNNNKDEPSFFEYLDEQKLQALESENKHLKKQIKEYKNILASISVEIDSLINTINN